MSWYVPARALRWNIHPGLCTPFQQRQALGNCRNKHRQSLSPPKPSQAAPCAPEGSLHLFSVPPFLPSPHFPSPPSFLPTFLLSFLLKNKDEKGPPQHVLRGSACRCCTLGLYRGLGSVGLWASQNFLSPHNLPDLARTPVLWWSQGSMYRSQGSSFWVQAALERSRVWRAQSQAPPQRFC